MADEKTSRLGVVDLNRVFGTINQFAEIQRKVDGYREELKRGLEEINQRLRQAKPTERETLQTEFEASRMTLASDMSQYATKLRNEVVEMIKQVIQEKAWSLTSTSFSTQEMSAWLDYQWSCTQNYSWI